jgi:hypothetical protein
MDDCGEFRDMLSEESTGSRVWGESVKNSHEYRQHAQECRALARAVHSEEHRAQLMKMAEAWESFAQQADRAAKAKKP